MQIAKSWRRQPSNLRLEGTKCNNCSHLEFTAAVRCSSCGSSDLEVYTFKGTGTVAAHTTVYEAPRDFADHVPYTAALVKLDEGITIPAMLTDIDNQDVHTGLRVTMVTRRIASHGDNGLIVYAYKFSPVYEGSL
jgi:uncharacterized OB-fold protein